MVRDTHADLRAKRQRTNATATTIGGTPRLGMVCCFSLLNASPGIFVHAYRESHFDIPNIYVLKIFPMNDVQIVLS